jgi:predicted nucleotidyltransferase
LRGWPSEPARHSLSARGIPNSISPRNICKTKSYGKKGMRKFKGSGLEELNKDDILESINNIMYEFNGKKEWEEGDLKNYYELLKRSSEHFNMPYDVFEKIYSDGNTFFEIEKIYLFGSRVTGFWRDDSDLDVYIKLKFHPRINNKIMNELAELMDGTIEYLNERDAMPKVKDRKGNEIIIDTPVVSTNEPTEKDIILLWEASK